MLRSKLIRTGLVSFTACIALGGAFIAGRTTIAEDQKPQPTAAEMEAKAMEGMMAYATPGEAHAKLGESVGNWTAEVKFFPTPDSPGESMTGASTISSLWENRFLVEEFQGDFAGMPFQGRSIVGYDNFKKEYFSIWMDSMSTGVMMSTGKMDADGKTLNMKGSMPDPITRSYKPTRSVETMPDANTRVMKMYDTWMDGKEYLHMEITYRRSK